MYVPKPGDRISITFTDRPSEVQQATICRLLDDRKEGLGPEIEDYVAYWLEISTSDCDDPGSHRVISFGTDSQYDLEGHKVLLARLST